MPGDEPVGDFISLNHARRLPWLTIDGNQLSLPTMYRMAHQGRRGVKLRTTFLGGKLVTREAWVREYVVAQTGAKSPTADDRTPSRRARQMRRAEQELQEAGI